MPDQEYTPNPLLDQGEQELSGDDPTLIVDKTASARGVARGGQGTARPGQTLNLNAGQAFQQETFCSITNEFGRYSLIRQIRVRSAEADLYLARDKQTDERVIVKLYRYGILPKMEITRKLEQLNSRFVPRLYHTGDLNERYFEIQEYLPEGSFAALLADDKAPSNEDFWLEVTEELSAAIAEIHSINVIHRDIKPSNILIRQRHPLQLALIDFGISSISEITLHLTSISRTVLYSSPESLTGVVSRASDYWSLGIILLEMITGQHPFHGLTEQLVNFQIVTGEVQIPASVPDDWARLINGLLTRDYGRRWGQKEVVQWLRGGGSDLPFTASPTSPELQPKASPYMFAGKAYHTPEQLGKAMAQNWTEALLHWKRRYVETWLSSQCGDQQRAARLGQLIMDQQLTREQELMLAITVLNPELPLSCRNEIVNRNWLRVNVELATAILESSLPQWHQSLTGNDWIRQLQEHWLETLNALIPYSRTVRLSPSGFLHKPVSLRQDCVEPPLRVYKAVNRLILSPPDEVLEAAHKYLQQYHRSTNPTLFEIIRKKELDYIEAVVLLGAPRDMIMTRRQYYRRLLSRYDLDLDEEKVEALLNCFPEDVIPRADEFRQNFEAAGNERLERLIHKPKLSYPEAIVLLSCDADLLIFKHGSTRRMLGNIIKPIGKLFSRKDKTRGKSSGGKDKGE